MTSENLAKFKEITEKADTVIIKTGQNIDLTKILAGELLRQTISMLGKAVGFDISRIPQNIRNGLAQLFLGVQAARKDLVEKENILIKLDTKKLPVAQLKYEKDGDVLKILLEGKTGGLDTSSILIEKEAVPSDLLVLIDPQNKESETLLVATAHKDAVKISSANTSIAVKVISIVKLLLGGVPKELNEPAFLLLETESRTDVSPSPEKLALLAELIKSGIDESKISKTKAEFYPAPFWKLLGRALARSHMEKESGIFWSLLTHGDFEKAGANEGSVLEVLEHIRSLKPESGFFAMLFERAQDPGANQKSISAIIAGHDAEKLNLLASSLATEPASSYFFANDFDSFSDAEIKIRSSIRKVML